MTDLASEAEHGSNVRESRSNWIRYGGSIGGLQISNPKGFETPYALRIEKAAVKINAQASTTKLIVLDQILVDQAEVNAEFVGRNGNLQTLQKNIEASVGPSEPSGEASDVKVIIERFDFTPASVGKLQIGLPGPVSSKHQ